MSLKDRDGGRFDYRRGESNVMIEAETGVMHFEDGGGDREPRDIEVRISRKWILPSQPPEETSLTKTLTVDQ